MARITVEDCTRLVPNRFDLVRMASIRTKQLKRGAKPLVDADDNKEIVVALREIAAGYIKPDMGTFEEKAIENAARAEGSKDAPE